jgi:hypothetical protein
MKAKNSKESKKLDRKDPEAVRDYYLHLGLESAKKVQAARALRKKKL